MKVLKMVIFVTTTTVVTKVDGQFGYNSWLASETLLRLQEKILLTTRDLHPKNIFRPIIYSPEAYNKYILKVFVFNMPILFINCFNNLKFICYILFNLFFTQLSC